jgi:hypothetical protein
MTESRTLGAQSVLFHLNIHSYIYVCVCVCVCINSSGQSFVRVRDIGNIEVCIGNRC